MTAFVNFQCTDCVSVWLIRSVCCEFHAHMDILLFVEHGTVLLSPTLIFPVTVLETVLWLRICSEIFILWLAAVSLNSIVLSICYTAGSSYVYQHFCHVAEQLNNDRQQNYLRMTSLDNEVFLYYIFTFSFWHQWRHYIKLYSYSWHKIYITWI